jgi:hypothetical protein
MTWFDYLCIGFVIFMAVVVFPSASRKEAKFENYEAIMQPFEARR